MTIQDIIKQTETFTIDQKQQLAYYFFFATISEDKKQDFMHLFHYKNDFDISKFENKTEKQTNSGITNLLKYSGILEGINTSDISEEELYLQGD